MSLELPRAPILGRRSLPAEDELRDLIDYRCVVEGGAASLAAQRATTTQLDHLDSLIAQMDEASEFSRWNEADNLFHLILADASHSHRVVAEVTELRSAVHDISALWDPEVPVSGMKLSNKGHREIVKRLRARRPDAARSAMVEHIESTLAIWMGLEARLASRAAGPDSSA